MPKIVSKKRNGRRKAFIKKITPKGKKGAGEKIKRVNPKKLPRKRRLFDV